MEVIFVVVALSRVVLVTAPNPVDFQLKMSTLTGDLTIGHDNPSHALQRYFINSIKDIFQIDFFFHLR